MADTATAPPCISRENNITHKYTISTFKKTSPIDSQIEKNNELPSNYDSIGTQEKEILNKALSTFEYISQSVYLGSTKSDVKEEIMPCNCTIIKDSKGNKTCCGEESDCINRLLFMECIKGVCIGGKYCQNQRFQRQLNSPIKLIEVTNKGYGIEAVEDFSPGQFVMEYVGEVISHNSLLRRTKRYTEQGAKHFYFMSLEPGKIIDATVSGSLARFINHSCNPNCILQKWIIGSQVCIGIFTKKSVKAGEELTFDYKFEQYGAVAQKCYCGESNCKGTLGSEKSIEQRELAELNRGFFSKRSRGLEDEEQCAKLISLMIQLNQLEPDKALLLLEKLYLTIEPTLLKFFIRLHGIVTLKTWLALFKDNEEIEKKILQVLEVLPFSCKNKLLDADIFSTLKEHADNKPSEVQEQVNSLISRWEALPKKYIIPRLPNTNTSTNTPSPEKVSTTPQPVFSSTTSPIEKRRDSFGDNNNKFKQPRSSSHLHKSSKFSDFHTHKSSQNRFLRPKNPKTDQNSHLTNRQHSRFGGFPSSKPSDKDFRDGNFYQEHHASNHRNNATPFNSKPFTDPNLNATSTFNSSPDTPGVSSQYHSKFKPVFSGRSYLHPLISTPNGFGHMPNVEPNIPPSLRIDFSQGLQPSHMSYSNTSFPTPGQINHLQTFPITPPTLPVDWLSAKTPEGQIYYYHRITMETTWNHPSQFSTFEKENLKHKQITRITTESQVKQLKEKPSKPISSSGAIWSSIKPVSEIYTKALGFSEKPYPRDELQARCKKMISIEVVKSFTPYLSHFDKDFFKKHAERMTLLLVEKEMREVCYQHGYLQFISSELRKKIHLFVKDYADKLVKKKKMYENSKKASFPDRLLAPKAI